MDGSASYDIVLCRIWNLTKHERQIFVRKTASNEFPIATFDRFTSYFLLPFLSSYARISRRLLLSDYFVLHCICVNTFLLNICLRFITR